MQNKFQHHNSQSKQTPVKHMKNGQIQKFGKRAHKTHMRPFNQQSTNNLLKQLQLSLQDVQNIITKSKQSLGLNQVTDSTHTNNDTSEINFNVSISGANNSIRDQLTYSISMCTQSRLMKSEDNMEASKLQTTNPAIRKLFQETPQKKQQKQSQRLGIKNHPPTPKNTNRKKLTINTAIEQTKNENKQMGDQGQRIQKTKEKIEYCQQKCKQNDQDKENSSFDRIQEEKSFRYQLLEEEYCIMINKNNNTTNNNNRRLQIKVVESKCQAQQIQITTPQKVNKRYIYQQQNNFKPTHNTLKKQIQQQQKIKSQKKPINIIDISNQLQRLSNNRPKINQFMLDQRQMNNTCAKNQLENILIKNFNSRKSNPNVSQQEIRRANQMHGDFRQSNQPKRAANLSPSYSPNLNKSAKKSNLFDLNLSRSPKVHDKSPKTPKTPKTPQKNRPQLFNSPVMGKEQQNRRTKPTYIQKYLNYLQKHQKKSDNIQIKRRAHKNQSHLSSNKGSKTFSSPKYSHPSKSPNSKRKSVLQIKQHMKTALQNSNRGQFIQKMLQQCYVRRFLNQTELSRIYDQFSIKKIPRYKWQQKVIQKIFTKIRQVDYLM